MEVRDIKNYLFNNNLVTSLLETIKCHSIRAHEGYITCANYNGDNPSAIVVYLNENLTVINYTKKIVKDDRTTDIIDLVCYNKDFSFPQAIKYLCDFLGLDYYSSSFEVPESIQLLQLLADMKMSNEPTEKRVLKPIPEEILSYYMRIGNVLFENDGIDLETQNEFEIGYSQVNNYITIPIRDMLGNLVGVKGRFFGDPTEYNPKYIYLEKCSKSQILYGYCNNTQYIKSSRYIYIFESEKGVLQAATMGIRNCVATGGKGISKTQIELITRTGCIPIFAYDKDVEEDKLIEIAKRFMNGIPVYAIVDRDNILDLNKKESPTDNKEKWAHLVKNNIYMISGD